MRWSSIIPEIQKQATQSLWVAAIHDVMGYIHHAASGMREATGGGSMVYYGQPTRWSNAVEKEISEVVESWLSPVIRPASAWPGTGMDQPHYWH